MPKYYAPIKVTYDTYNETVNEAYMLNIFRAFLATEDKQIFATRWLFRFRGTPMTRKEDAVAEARSRNWAEREDAKLSRGPGRFKTTWLAKEVDENGDPVVSKALIKKTINFIKENHPYDYNDIKEEYKD